MLGIRSVKASYSREFWKPNRSSRLGIGSIRDDLQIPSTPYFPAYYAEEGQEPNDQEGPQNVESRLFQQRIVRCAGQVGPEMANNLVAQLLYLDAVDPNKDIIMYVNSPGGSVTDGLAIFDTMRHVRPDVCTICVGLAAREKSGLVEPSMPVISEKMEPFTVVMRGLHLLPFVGDCWGAIEVGDNMDLVHGEDRNGLSLFHCTPIAVGEAVVWEEKVVLEKCISGGGARMGAEKDEHMGAFLLCAGTKGKRYSLPSSRILIHQPLGGAQGSQTDIEVQGWDPRVGQLGATTTPKLLKDTIVVLATNICKLYRPDEMLFHKANLSGHMARLTGQSLEKIYQDTDRDFFMSAKEAKEYGLIDGVIMNPVKALFNLPVGAD
ncbi:nuclear encoded CLP protease 5 [Actinidia rufa]|uniref:ATP-dependent Clp protease proteolytic subunit n=1 Tax=Actinidia rufa TaxID=165716 RepID=A0A7J0FIY6_9ERIC|nr:nuclear encoded CLP protease 5 [Actinidia rufa]